MRIERISQKYPKRKERIVALGKREQNKKKMREKEREGKKLRKNE